MFWVNQSGTHGLIVSMDNISTSPVAWTNISNTSIGPIKNNDWDGFVNSNAIVAQAGHTSSAAKLCLDYTNANFGTGIYSDWYLPAIEEFKQLYANLKDVHIALVLDRNPATNTILISIYWSSTEYYSPNPNLARYFDFYTGSTDYGNKNNTYLVRAVRAF